MQKDKFYNSFSLLLKLYKYTIHIFFFFFFLNVLFLGNFTRARDMKSFLFLINILLYWFLLISDYMKVKVLFCWLVIYDYQSCSAKLTHSALDKRNIPLNIIINDHQSVLTTRICLILLCHLALLTIIIGKLSRYLPVSIQQLNVSFCWSVNIYMFMCWIRWDNVTYEFILTILPVFVLLWWSVRWEVSDRTATVLYGATAARICLKQSIA